MFVIDASHLLPECFKVTKEEINQLWNYRYAHLSLNGLRTLAKNDLVKGLPYITESDGICNDCLKGKQHRKSFLQQSTRRASKKLQLLHVDICGPLKPVFNSGKRYLITFIDDMTRKTWVYLVSEKSIALECFKKFKATIENECGETVKCLRTNRGGEFTYYEF